jgi:hypothetical protein
MKRLLIVGAACVLVFAAGIGVLVLMRTRTQNRRVLRVTDVEGVTTDVHQPLVTRYLSGACSSDACPYEEVAGLRIESGPGAEPVDIRWAQLASVEFVPQEGAGNGAHPNPVALLTLRDGTTRKASVSSYELNGTAEFANYSVSIGDLKSIIVAEDGEPPILPELGYSQDKLQITVANGTTQTWDASADTAYPIIVGGAINLNSANDARDGIRLWRGKAAFDINWASLKEADVNADNAPGGQPILRVICVFANGQTSDFTVDPAPGPRIRQQLPGNDQYNELKLEDVRRIVVTPGP